MKIFASEEAPFAAVETKSVFEDVVPGNRRAKAARAVAADDFESRWPIIKGDYFLMADRIARRSMSTFVPPPPLMLTRMPMPPKAIKS